jgi:hypothetical protein
MKALQNGNLDLERHRLEADLVARLAAIFARSPELCGFLVGERVVALHEAEGGGVELELFVAGIDTYPALGSEHSERLVANISASLGELMNENPQVADLLAGRTFARTLH